jgi:hypothetical protein
MSKYTFVMIGFLLFFLLSRIVSNGANRKLDDATRHRIVDEFSPRNNTKIIVVVALCTGYLLAITYLSSWSGIISIVFFLAFLTYLVASFIRTRKRLQSIQAPANYIRSIAISWTLFIIGFGLVSAGVAFL